MIENSWEAYQQNKESCHHQVKEALQRAAVEIEKMRLVSGEREDLLSLLLNPDREKRITSTEALEHPFFRKK